MAKSQQTQQATNPGKTSYFQSLPPFIQETLAQNGMMSAHKKDLHACVNHLIQQAENK